MHPTLEAPQGGLGVRLLAMRISIVAVPALADDAAIQALFHTYLNWQPKVPAGLAADSDINAGNVDCFSAVLDPAMVQHINDG
jgi:hypothetical protein